MTPYPPFDPDVSDGCTGVRQIARHCCVEHDRAYWYGRTLLDKWRADLGLGRCIFCEGWRRVKACDAPGLSLIGWAVLAVCRAGFVAVFVWGAFYGKPHKRAAP